MTGKTASHAAVVAVKPSTGELLAMVRSADFNSVVISGQINMALSPRQPGSSIKPFTIWLALRDARRGRHEPGSAGRRRNHTHPGQRDRTAGILDARDRDHGRRARSFPTAPTRPTCR